jgi:hypothetical protein
VKTRIYKEQFSIWVPILYTNVMFMKDYGQNLDTITKVLYFKLHLIILGEDNIFCVVLVNAITCLKLIIPYSAWNNSQMSKLEYDMSIFFKFVVCESKTNMQKS